MLTLPSFDRKSPEILVENNQGQMWVVSIDQKSIRMRPGKRERRAQELSVDQDMLQHWLGNYAVHADIEIGKNPFAATHQKAIILSREFVPGKSTDIFNGAKVDELALKKATNIQPELAYHLGEFARLGLMMSEKIGMVPDTDGLFVPSDRESDPLLVPGLPKQARVDTAGFQIEQSRLRSLSAILN